MDDKTAALSNTSIFSGLSNKHLALISRVTDQVTLDSGSVMIHQDQVTTHMAIFIDGAGEVTVDGKHVADVGPGDVVGELSMVDGERASATVTVTETANVWYIGRSGFIPVWEKNPDMSTPMLLAVVAKLRETNQLLTS